MGVRAEDVVVRRDPDSDSDFKQQSGKSDGEPVLSGSSSDLASATSVAA